MQTLIHPVSGETILGVRLPPGTEIGKGDKYDSGDGTWREAGCAAGLTIQPRCTTVWVRQPLPLSDNARTLLGYLCQQPWGEKSCIGKRDNNFYVIPSPTFNWDGRIDIEASRVLHPECVRELFDHGYLTFSEHSPTNWSSDYSTVWKDDLNQVYILTDDGKEEGKKTITG